MSGAQGSQPAWAAGSSNQGGGHGAQGGSPSWMPSAPAQPPMHSSQPGGQHGDRSPQQSWQGQHGGADPQGEANHYGHSQGQDDRQIEQLRQMLEAQSRESEELKGTLAKLRGALGVEGEQTGEDGGEEEDTGWYDDILQTALQYEKEGRGIPVTVDLATRTKKTMDSNKQLRAELAQLQRMVQQNLNPETQHNQQAFTSIDTQISNTIEQSYGQIDPHFQRYVASNVAEEIQRMQREDPDLWKRVRTTPSLQQKMVSHYVRQAVPQNVRQHLEQEYLATSPMTKEELVQAWTEADQIPDENLRAQVKREARQRYLETMVNGNKDQSFEGMVRRYRGR